MKMQNTFYTHRSWILHFLILGLLFSSGDHNTNESVVSRLVDESPRWLWAQGQAEKAVAIVEKAMKKNGCKEKLDVAYFIAKGEGKIIVSDTASAGLTDLVKTPNLRSRTFNVVFNWCVFYEGHLESKERFAIKKYLLIIGKKRNMQVLSHTFTYFST